MLRDYQIQIIKNVYRSWIQGHKRPCIVAPCGSGKTVIASELAKQTTDLGEKVLFIVHRKEIRDQTEATFRKYGVNMELCTVGMVHTLVRRKILTPRLIIMDENHHVYAASYIKILERYPNANVVGLTATPIRLDGGGLGKINDNLIIGPSVAALIASGHLASFRYYSHISADTSKLQIRRGEFVASEVDKIMGQNCVYGDTIENYIKHGLNKTIVYCSNIKNSVATADAFHSAGIAAVHVDGKTPKNERDKIMEGFRSGRIKVLCNVDLVSEGFDVPDCDSCILLRPTMSLTLHIQQSMRCMRRAPGKTAIIIDQVENFIRHGLPDTPREWNLEYKVISENKTRECKNCSSVYDAHIIFCEACGWDMRSARCVDCGFRQQFGFGICEKCGSILEYIQNRSERERIEAELQEIKSFRFRDSDNYKIIDDLRRIQKANGAPLSSVYNALKEIGM